MRNGIAEGPPPGGRQAGPGRQKANGIGVETESREESFVKLQRVRLRVLTMRLKAPFVTSFGRETDRRFLLVEANLDGVTGLGEVTCSDEPFYSEEFTRGALLVLRDFLVPALIDRSIEHPSEVIDRLAFVRRHHGQSTKLSMP